MKNVNTNRCNGKMLGEYILDLEKKYEEAIKNSDYYSAMNIQREIEALKLFYYGL